MTDLLKCTFVFFLCVSCSHDSSLGEDVYQLKSNPILIDWNRMECIEDEFDTVSFHRDSAKLKLIVYVDSTRCSPLRACGFGNPHFCCAGFGNPSQQDSRSFLG